MNKDIAKTALVFMLAGLVSGIIIGFCFGRTARQRTESKIVTDTILHIDTIAYYQPMAKDSTVVRFVTKVLPIAGNIDANNIPQKGNNDTVNIPQLALTADSVEVAIPITQKRYDGDDYRAYVIGYQPSLDSIYVYRKTETITIRETPRRWSVGLQGGVGYGFVSKRIEPFVGIGVSYRLW